MARPLGIEFPGAVYHVISRGNEKRCIVRDDADRRKRLDWLRRTVEVYGGRLHAFVRMTTHYNGSDTGYFHRRHRRSDHLFPGRFKGQLIAEQGSFLEVKSLRAPQSRSGEAGCPAAGVAVEQLPGVPARRPPTGLGVLPARAGGFRP